MKFALQKKISVSLVVSRVFFLSFCTPILPLMLPKLQLLDFFSPHYLVFTDNKTRRKNKCTYIPREWYTISDNQMASQEVCLNQCFSMNEWMRQNEHSEAVSLTRLKLWTCCQCAKPLLFLPNWTFTSSHMIGLVARIMGGIRNVNQWTEVIRLEISNGLSICLLSA